MLLRQDIRVRDPFILPDRGTYYLYVTTGEKTLSYYRSKDLEHWEPGGVAFTIPEDSWACRDVWAAEVHPYRGRFYLFVSLLGKTGLRATQIAVADTPAGPFLPLVDRGVTPPDQSCIDGTLYVQHGIPYIIYSHDWPDHYVESQGAYVGEICAAQLREDLTCIVGRPFRLFASDEAPISRATPHAITWQGRKGKRYGSDAPFVQRLSDGRLLLTWSPYLNGNYVVLYAIAETGDIHGAWRHGDAPLFDRNGGHAMFFTTFQGERCMCLHAPEAEMQERANLFIVAECPAGMQILSPL